MKECPEPSHARATLSALCLLVLALAVSCVEPAPYRVGFSTALTGRNATIGLEIREGAMLAVEELANAGLAMELVIRDDSGDPELALVNDREFADLGLELVMGHATSAVAARVLPFLEERGMVLLGSTISSPLFDAKDDPLIRVSNSSISEPRALADFLAPRIGSGPVIAVYDWNNEAYAGPWVSVFRQAWTTLGGAEVVETGFYSGTSTDYADLATRALGAAPLAKAAAVVASPLDSAAICQALRRLSPDIFIVAGGWANAADLIAQGGRSVEGVTLAQMYALGDRSERHLGFVAAYRDRFGRDPGFASAHSYEAVRLLAAALRARKKGQSLKSALLSVGSLEGVQDRISIDRFGDASRPLSLIQVQDGAFVVVEKREPSL